MAARLAVIAGHVGGVRHHFASATGATPWAMHFVEPVPADHLLPVRSLKGKTLFVTGASRGIGLAIALRAAQDGANVVIAAKTTEANPKLEGTIFTAAEEVIKAGGQSLAVKCDIRSEESVAEAVKQAVAKFGGIDILVNNASAINLSSTEQLDMKRYDLMHQINARGTYLCTKYCLPHLKKASNPHILTLSPPITLQERWFKEHPAYTVAKFGMSLYVFGHAAEFREFGIGVNALWPRTTIGTAAVRNLLGGQALVDRSRTPEIMGDAAHAILTRVSTKVTGNFFVDDDVLCSEGVTDFSKYNPAPNMQTADLCRDGFV